ALLAARERSAIGLVLSGFAAALVHARAGDAESANAEIRAAARRALHLPLGPGVSIVQMAIARALSILGRAPEARALLRDATATSGAPLLLEHAEWLTQSCILAAEGRTLEALDSAEEASELSDVPGSRILHLRDLYQLAALGAADDVLLYKMRSIAESSDISAAHGLAQRATAMMRGQKTVSQRTPVERLRQGAPWSNAMSVSAEPPPLGTPQSTAQAGTVPPLLQASMALGLTRREQEIADLVAEGLSNREIAAQLFLSVRTVESHVYQARAKVGAGSRRELGRLAGARLRPRDGASG
ncbi:MAG: helix-turn-helix transcriptional regulator, partial [Microbacterium sp.]